MGRGGGRGGGGQSTSRQVANALGIAQHEMAAFMRQKASEVPQPYPQIQRSILPLEMTTELQYMADVKSELRARFMESAFNLDADDEKVDIKRYTDKYKKIDRDPFIPDADRIPDELVDEKGKKKKEGKNRKRRKLNDGEVKNISEKLNRLEENEKSGDDDDVEDESTDEDSDKEQAAAGLSEDDMEEDNDYVHAYFDNGEGYHDGSDDNLGDDDY